MEGSAGGGVERAVERGGERAADRGGGRRSYTPPPGGEGAGRGLDVPRVLGRVEGTTDGPTLVCVGGVHGNEPAGVLGLQRVLGPLADRTDRLRGRFVALAGNRTALRAGRRFVDRDLNRAWTDEGLRRLEAREAADTPDGDIAGESVEGREQLELLHAIEEGVAETTGPVFFLDLHTTSGLGGPFVTVADTLPNRAFGLNFVAPLILGLEEMVDGTLLEYVGRRGYVTAAFESGQHAEEEAVDRAAAAIWIAIVAAGLLGESDVPELPGARKLLREETRHLPHVLEMRHRHPVGTDDGFRMRDGYRNFQRVKAGEVVALDRTGPVEVPESARILMPLYQPQGEDGFFVVREFRPFWLHVSLALRRLGVGEVVHWLPGIRRHPEREDALVVDRRVARWYALQLLHLLGFRRHEDDGRRLVVLKRPFDVRAPGQDGAG